MTDPNLSTRGSYQTHSVFWACGILAVFFTVYFSVALYQIPYEQLEGICAGWMRAVETPWSKLFFYLWAPVSVQLLASDVRLIEVRVFESLIEKGIYGIFGESLPAIGIFNILMAAALAILMFGLVFYFTRNKIAAFLSSFFLLTTPAYLWAVIEYGDYAPSDHVLLALYFFVFLSQVNQIYKDPKALPFWRYCLNAVFLYAAGMAAIHAKEPNKFMIPAVTACILFFNFRNGLFKCGPEKRRALLPTVITGVLFFLPIFIVKHRSSEPLKLDFRGPFYQLIYHPTSWGTNKKFSLFDPSYGDLPVSVLANLGFFLGWLFIIALITLAIRRIKIGSGKSEGQKVSRLLFFGSWFSIASSFYLAHNSASFFRYTTWALLPFVVLVAIVLTRFYETVTKPIFQKLTALLIVGLTIYTAILNIQHSFFTRRQLNRLWTPKWDFFSTAYQDHTGKTSPGLFELYHFWCRDPFAKATFNYALPELALDNPLENLEFAENLKRQKKLYAASKTRLAETPGKISLLKEIDWNRIDWQSERRAERKKMNPNPLYLYRIETQG